MYAYDMLSKQLPLYGCCGSRIMSSTRYMRLFAGKRVGIPIVRSSCKVSLACPMPGKNTAARCSAISEYGIRAGSSLRNRSLQQLSSDRRGTSSIRQRQTLQECPADARGGSGEAAAAASCLSFRYQRCPRSDSVHRFVVPSLTTTTS